MKLFLILVFLLIFSINGLAVDVDVFDITNVRVLDSMGVEISGNVVDIAIGSITIEAIVRNLSTTDETVLVEFSESTNILPIQTDTQTITAGNNTTFITSYDISGLVEGENYLIYANATPNASETVVGNNSSFVVISIVSPAGVLPIPEMHFAFIPIIALIVLIILWKEKNEHK